MLQSPSAVTWELGTESDSSELRGQTDIFGIGCSHLLMKRSMTARKQHG